VELINIPKGKSYLFWEHAMKSVFAFASTFAILFFVPMFLGSRRSRSGNSSKIFEFVVGFMVENQIATVLFCLFIVLVVNVVIVIKNNKSIYVKSINIGSDKLVFELTNLRLSKSRFKEIELEYLDLELLNSTIDEKSKEQVLRFKDSRNDEIFSKILLSHLLWEKNTFLMKKLIDQLIELKVDFESIHEDKNSIATTVFKPRY
jgi:hypothetical protein